MEKLRQAFALAHRQSQNEGLDNGTRCEFRAIQHLIWCACGNDPRVSLDERTKEDLQAVRP